MIPTLIIPVPHHGTYENTDRVINVDNIEIIEMNVVIWTIIWTTDPGLYYLLKSEIS